MSEVADPTRDAALRRLREFAPRMGRLYAEGRNSDPGPGARADVARLSPHVRHRLVTEEELVGTALAAHGERAAEKFIQEAFWRTYWKGYLQLRPGMWTQYRRDAARDAAMLRTQGGLRGAFGKATEGATGIGCFDAWAREVQEEGWLHNHARMWFASIWIFTLRLPWRLGAEFFLRHLKDADPASNTLSWRWVAGIQTPGKHYLARAENIARHTHGRFDPRGELDEDAAPLDEPGPPAAGRLDDLPPVPAGPVALLLHEEDLHVESLPGWDVHRVAGVSLAGTRSVLGCAEGPRRWSEGALEDALARAAARWGVPAERIAPEDVARWAGGLPVVAPDVPVGWVADGLAGAGLRRWRRSWDAACWPLARKGFFPFRTEIPRLIRELSPREP